MFDQPMTINQGGPATQPALRRFLFLGQDAGAGRLIRRADLVHGGVVRIDDVRASLLVERLHDEVEKVAVRAGGDAEDAEVADITDMHRRCRDLGGSPRGPRRPQVQVQRLRCVAIPAAAGWVVGPFLVGPSGALAPPGGRASEWTRGAAGGGGAVRGGRPA